MNNTIGFEILLEIQEKKTPIREMWNRGGGCWKVVGGIEPALHNLAPPTIKQFTLQQLAQPQQMQN